MTEIQKAVRTNIRKYLNLKKLSQRKFAEQSEVSTATISKAATKGYLSTTIAKQISEKTQISMDYLYGNSDKISILDHVVDFVLQHFCIDETESFEGLEHKFPYIEVSKPFREYFQAISKINNSLGMGEEEREINRQKEKEHLKEVLRKEKDVKMEMLELQI